MKEKINRIMKTINDTYGYGKKGSHPKKCIICEQYFEESNDLEELITNGDANCPNCKEILELKDFLEDYSNLIRNIQIDDPIYNKNMKETRKIETSFGIVTCYSLDSSDDSTEYLNRTNKIKDLIERITNGRNYLYLNIGPKINMLRSIYERNDIFWEDGGSLKNYVSEILVEYVIIKLQEFLTLNKNSCRFSLKKIKNIILNDKTNIYENQKVFIIKKYKTSGDSQRIEFPRFEIDGYLEKIEKVMNKYREIINAFDDYRDTKFAHIDNLKDINSTNHLKYINIIKIYNSLKIIYDGLLFSVAPDLYKHYEVLDGINYSHLNEISKYYTENVKIE